MATDWSSFYNPVASGDSERSEFYNQLSYSDRQNIGWAQAYVQGDAAAVAQFNFWKNIEVNAPAHMRVAGSETVGNTVRFIESYAENRRSGISGYESIIDAASDAGGSIRRFYTPEEQAARDAAAYAQAQAERDARSNFGEMLGHMAGVAVVGAAIVGTAGLAGVGGVTAGSGIAAAESAAAVAGAEAAAAGTAGAVTAGTASGTVSTVTAGLAAVNTGINVANAVATGDPRAIVNAVAPATGIEIPKLPTPQITVDGVTAQDLAPLTNVLPQIAGQFQAQSDLIKSSIVPAATPAPASNPLPIILGTVSLMAIALFLIKKRHF